MSGPLRQKTVDEEAERFAKALAWLDPDLAADVCRRVYQIQQRRRRAKLLARYCPTAAEG